MQALDGLVGFGALQPMTLASQSLAFQPVGLIAGRERGCVFSGNLSF